MAKTNAERRHRVRELAGTSVREAGTASLRTRTLVRAAEDIGIENPPSSGPMCRKAIRVRLRELDGGSPSMFNVDANDLRADEIDDLIAALEEADDG